MTSITATQHPTESTHNKAFGALRQAQIVAGVLTLTGVTLALAANLHWVYLSGFVGLGLIFAGASGVCPMELALKACPWNRTE